jgi:mannitol/fructose-specific phosphotransferase system IIA component (Ntr-type)
MPATVDLTEVLRVEDIHLNFKAASVIEAIPLLLRPALIRRLGQRAVVDEIVAAVIKREEETATLCGPLALPHARHSAVAEFILSLAASADGAIAGRSEPRLIFAFVSPEGRREQHLQLLAWLARISQNRKLIEQIAGASSTDQVLDALRGAGA